MLSHKRPYQDRAWIKWGVRKKLQGRFLSAFSVCILPQILPWLMRLMPTNFGIVNIQITNMSIIGISLPMLALSLLATIFVTDPMQVKIAAYFLRLNRDPENLPSPLSVCDCFGPGYGRLVLGMLLRNLRIWAWSIVPLVIGLVAFRSFEWVEMSGYDAIRLSPMFAAVMLVAVGCVVYWDIVYEMVPYLLADDPLISPADALRKSRELTRGRVAELLFLQISFIGWAFLAIMTMFIGAIYMYPYMEGTVAAYYLAFITPTSSPEKDEAYAA